MAHGVAQMGGRLQGGGEAGVGQADASLHNGGVAPGTVPYQNAVQAQGQGPSLADIQRDMARQQVGAQLNQNPQNSALAGYMMS